MAQAKKHAGRKKSRARIDPERRAEIGREKRARTRQIILNAAFELMGRERGLRTRIEEINSLAGLSRGTFYNYFTSMDDVLDALQYELNHEFDQAVHRIIDQMTDAAEQAGSAIRYYLDRARHDPKWGWAMVNISAGGIIFGAETYRRAQLTIEEGIESGVFNLTAATSGRDLLLGAGWAAMVTVLRSHPSENYPISVTRHVLRGMGVPQARVEEIIRKPLAEPVYPAPIKARQTSVSKRALR